jgi:hypothetical protein
MTTEMREFIDVNVENGGPKDSEDGYVAFKDALREKYGVMESKDYDAAIKAYCDRWEL